MTGPGYVNYHANGIDWNALREEQAAEEYRQYRRENEAPAVYSGSPDDREQLALSIQYACFQFFQEPETFSAHRVSTEVVDALLRDEHTRGLLRRLLETPA